jgi:hypothetical protein
VTVLLQQHQQQPQLQVQVQPQPLQVQSPAQVMTQTRLHAKPQLKVGTLPLANSTSLLTSHAAQALVLCVQCPGFMG